MPSNGNNGPIYAFSMLYRMDHMEKMNIHKNRNKNNGQTESACVMNCSELFRLFLRFS